MTTLLVGSFIILAIVQEHAFRIFVIITLLLIYGKLAEKNTQ